tara:strand:- start:714 stop:1292 length:579 start_codon:yes stop_codon:yes gene_type:complete
MLSFQELSEKKKTSIKINPKKDELMEKESSRNHGQECDCKICEKKRNRDEDGPDVATESTNLNQEDTAYEGQEEVCEKSNQENEPSILTFGNFINEKTRYAKETGKNLKKGKPQPEGGSAKKDLAYQTVLARIKAEYGAGAVQQSSKEKKKVKGDKTRRQAGDNKFTPAEKVAKRRASKAAADAAMRDTRGT